VAAAWRDRRVGTVGFGAVLRVVLRVMPRPFCPSVATYTFWTTAGHGQRPTEAGEDEQEITIDFARRALGRRVSSEVSR
jgi:hypothetical protein